MKWYLGVMKNYGNFDGRARRKEFWMFQLVNQLVLYVFYLMSPLFLWNTFLSFLFLILMIIVAIIPAWSVMVRRLHDINFSGLWILINLVPFLGPITLFIFTVMEGTSGDNKFGPDPKAIEEIGKLFHS